MFLLSSPVDRQTYSSSQPFAWYSADLQANRGESMGMKLQGAEIERHGPVGLVKIHPVERMMERSLEPDCDEFIEVHAAISLCLDELRFDDSVRIVVITGSQEGVFYAAPSRSHYDVKR